MTLGGPFPLGYFMGPCSFLPSTGIKSGIHSQEPPRPPTHPKTRSHGLPDCCLRMKAGALWGPQCHPMGGSVLGEPPAGQGAPQRGGPMLQFLSLEPTTRLVSPQIRQAVGFFIKSQLVSLPQEMFRVVSPNVSSPKSSQDLGRRSPAGDNGAGPALPSADPKITEPTTQPSPSIPLISATDAEEDPKRRFPRGITTSRGARGQFNRGGLVPFTSVPRFPPVLAETRGALGCLPIPKTLQDLGAEPQTWLGLLLAASSGSSPAAAGDRQLLNQPLCSAALK